MENNLSQSSRALYIVLGVFLGGLGIHNFYAKRIWPALAQLVLVIGAMGGDWLLAQDHAGHERARQMGAMGDDGTSYFVAEPYPHLPLYSAAAILLVWIVWEVVRVSRDGDGVRMR